MTSRIQPRSMHAENARTLFKEAEKASRRSAEDLREAHKDFEIAQGMCSEYLSGKLGVDEELARRIDNARVIGAKYFQMADDDAITTDKLMKALDNELNHLHADIAILQKACGFPDPSAAPAAEGTNMAQPSGTAQTASA